MTAAPSANRWFAFVDRIPLLRWLFVMRKTYLIKAWKVHYSQWGEDVVLDRFLNKVPHGCYIDVGCYHPRKHSNTYRLHRLGWRGINIDVDPIKKAVFDAARPDDENICCAVGNTPGEATIYTFGHYSLLTPWTRKRPPNTSARAMPAPLARSRFVASATSSTAPALPASPSPCSASMSKATRRPCCAPWTSAASARR